MEQYLSRAKKSGERLYYETLLSHSASLLFAKASVAPLDRLRISWQVCTLSGGGDSSAPQAQFGAAGSQSLKRPSFLWSMMKHYRGFFTHMTHVSASNGLRFFLHYSTLFTLTPETVLSKELSSSQNGSAGQTGQSGQSKSSKGFWFQYTSHLFPGAVACLLTYPLDAAYTRRATRGDTGLIQSPVVTEKYRWYNYRAWIHKARCMYSGASICLLAVPCGLFVSLGSLRVLERVLGDEFVHSYPANVLMGSSVACLGSLVTYPLDTIRRRMIIVNGAGSYAYAMASGRLFAGSSLLLVKLIPESICLVTGYLALLQITSLWKGKAE